MVGGVVWEGRGKGVLNGGNRETGKQAGRHEIAVCA